MARRIGTGQGGKSMQDRELANKVRTRALADLLLILNEDKRVEKWSEYKKRIIEKMSVAILPRLNEHAGEGGGAIKTETVITGMQIIRDGN
jgi:hypothetical protein